VAAMQDAKKPKPQIEDNFILVSRDHPDSKQPEEERTTQVGTIISSEDSTDSETQPSKVKKMHDISKAERKQLMLEFYKPL
jgi:hypothetical protein